MPKTFTRYQKFVIAILTFLQFTIILDFMVLSPLGALLMPALKISPQQFGAVVSIYAFSAGLSGFLAAGFADKFDRKKILIFFYSGFVLGTLLCGIASTYSFLLFARLITGLFGGVVGSIVLAITTDLFSFEVRGRVMGFIQTAFAASQILGLPLSLFLANQFGWHAPFLLIVAVSFFVGIFMIVYLKPIDAHLKLHQDRKAFQHLLTTVTTRRYVQAFATIALLATGGFMIMPFSSAFLVHNVGIDVAKLPLIYLITGICTIFIGPIIGRASDTIGKFNMFTFGSLLSIVMVVIYTNLSVTPMYLVVLTNTVLFFAIFSRVIPSQALMSAIPEPAYRGAFMSVIGSIQQMSGGLASALAGMIVVEGPGGALQNFNVVGYVVIGASIVTLIQMYFINRSLR